MEKMEEMVTGLNVHKRGVYPHITTHSFSHHSQPSAKQLA